MVNDFQDLYLYAAYFKFILNMLHISNFTNIIRIVESHHSIKGISKCFLTDILYSNKDFSM